MSTLQGLDGNREVRERTREEFVTCLQQEARDADVTMLFAELLGYAAQEAESVPRYLNSLALGLSPRSEGSGFRLPSSMMEEFDDLEGMPRWDVEITIGDGTTDNPRTAYVPVERFIHVASIAALLYAQIVDDTFDPWQAIAGMQANCNLIAQKACIPDEIKAYLGREHFAEIK